MSRMSDLSLDIQTMLAEDVAPSEIAKLLNIPLDWIYTEIEQHEHLEVYQGNPYYGA